MTQQKIHATAEEPHLKPIGSQNEANALVFDEIQLLLAEKRTAYSGMRTGIAVFALPLSVLSVLVATSRMYNLGQVLQWVIPLLVLCAGLVFLGCYLVFHSITRVHYYDHQIKTLKEKYSSLADFVR